MFPIQLDYFLSTSAEDCCAERIHSLLPGLDWGEGAGLLKHSDDWPEAVAFVSSWRGYGPDQCGQFPVEITFPHYPGRVSGNDAVMLPTKLALLRKLAESFECRVMCRSFDFCHEEDGVRSYEIQEAFLCQGGRVYCAAIAARDVLEGARPADGWLPLDDLPVVSLDRSGALLDRNAAVAAVADWIQQRDQSHLHAARVIYPTPPEPEPEPEPEPDLEPELFTTPSEEEIERQEKELAAHFERLDQWERGYETTASKQLVSSGISLPDPDSLSDDELPEKLWAVIHGLRDNNTYLYSTDHLSDRELYAWLWREGLNEGTMDLSGLSGCGVHLDLLGSGDEESKNLSLIYYDSAEDRADWFASWPEDTIPAHIDPPYDRDLHLPKCNY